MIYVRKSTICSLETDALVVPIYENGKIFPCFSRKFFGCYRENLKDKFSETITDKNVIGDIIKLSGRKRNKNIKSFYFLVAKKNKQELFDSEKSFEIYDKVLSQVKMDGLKSVSLPRFNVEDSYSSYPLVADCMHNLILRHMCDFNITVFDSDMDFLKDLYDKFSSKNKCA